MLWYSLEKRFERSEAVERFERFELASVYFGSGPSYVIRSKTVSFQKNVFSALRASLSATKLSP
jgi:hypothetical protein